MAKLSSKKKDKFFIYEEQKCFLFLHFVFVIFREKWIFEDGDLKISKTVSLNPFEISDWNIAQKPDNLSGLAIFTSFSDFSTAKPRFPGLIKTLYTEITNDLQALILRQLVVEMGSQGQFHQCSTSSFYARRSQTRKKDCQVKQLYCAFGICARKICL